MNHLKIALIAASAASVLSLSACVVAPYPGGYAYQSTDDVVVDVAPPAPYTEVIPPIPYPGAIWIGGYWGWSGGRHTWIPGRYDHGRPGYFYHQSSWGRDGGGRYHFHRGGWARR
jgi:hypothetical protein